MEFLSQTILGLSAAAIFIGIIFMLAPSGNISKSVRYAFTLVFLCVCITLFLGLGRADFKLSFSDEEVDYTSAQRLTEAQAEYICAAALNDAGLAFNEISVSTDINEVDGIFISNITVKSDENPDLITELIEEIVQTKEVTVE